MYMRDEYNRLLEIRNKAQSELDWGWTYWTSINKDLVSKLENDIADAESRMERIRKHYLNRRYGYNYAE